MHLKLDNISRILYGLTTVKPSFDINFLNSYFFYRKKWLPQQLRKLSHSKTDKLPVDKSALKKGSDKKSKVSHRPDLNLDI